MSKTKTPTATTYTKHEHLGAVSYECVLCGNSAPDLEAAGLHRAAHVAGPDLLELAKDVAKLAPATKTHNPGIGAGRLNQIIDKANAAIAKAEPAKG